MGFRVLTDRNINLASQNSINILLLGVGGGVHEGPDLTDSIIFANIDLASKSATLVSLPRDFWSSEIHAKINSAYTIGEKKQKGGGLLLSKAVIGKILGQEIDYGIKIDFAGFVKAVDDIGGLDITVDNTFDDYLYPITGKEDDPCGHTTEEAQLLATSEAELKAFPCRYEHLHFDKGTRHFDGITALKFVRSRHAEGIEGSDFARSKRQQKAIEALKEKLFSAGTILNPGKIFKIIDDIKESIDTDITEEEYSEFIKLAQEMRGVNIKTAVIETGDEEKGRPELLYNPRISSEYGNMWVLIPKAGDGNYEEIHDFVKLVCTSCP